MPDRPFPATLAEAEAWVGEYAAGSSDAVLRRALEAVLTELSGLQRIERAAAALTGNWDTARQEKRMALLRGLATALNGETS